MSNYVSLSLERAAALTLDAWESDPHTAPLWLGDPGIGKTHKISELRYSLAGMLAPRLHEMYPTVGFMVPGQTQQGIGLVPREWAFAPLEVAHGADEDIGGIPVRDAQSGAVVRLPIGPLRACSRDVGPGVLFLDEISRAGAQKQGCCLTITNEGRAGDFYLNIGSRVCLAANGVEQSGTHTIIDALLNRCLVIEIEPSADEFREYLRTRVGAPSSSLRELAIDFAATSEKAPDLIQLKMPPGATESGQLWASPRAIEKAIKVFDVALARGRSGELLHASLAGLIGKEAAGVYMNVRRVRERLPSPKDIEANPTGALVPKADDAEANVGTLGLVNIVAHRNPDAAWLYAGRLQNRECGTALAKGLLRYVPKDPNAVKTKFKLMAQFGVASEG